MLGPGQGAGGVLWKLAEPGRQLDANLVHLAADQHVPAHAEPDVDVLLLVVRGAGVLRSDHVPGRELTEGTVLWLPRGSTRSITARDEGLSYFTAHMRRPGLQIGLDRTGSSPA
nr:cupin domain-containing protein [Saccharopolyspora sp. HNM0983]